MLRTQPRRNSEFFQLMAFLRNVLQGDDDSELYFELVKTFCVEGES